MTRRDLEYGEAVYVAVRPADGMVKVGVSIWPAERMRTLSVTSGSPVVLLGLLTLGETDRPRRLERRILDDLAEHRHEGEWLHPVPEVAAYLAPLIDDEATARACGPTCGNSVDDEPRSVDGAEPVDG